MLYTKTCNLLSFHHSFLFLLSLFVIVVVNSLKCIHISFFKEIFIWTFSNSTSPLWNSRAVACTTGLLYSMYRLCAKISYACFFWTLWNKVFKYSHYSDYRQSWLSRVSFSLMCTNFMAMMVAGKESDFLLLSPTFSIQNCPPPRLVASPVYVTHSWRAKRKWKSTALAGIWTLPVDSIFCTVNHLSTHISRDWVPNC